MLNTIHTWLLVGGSLVLFAACAYVFFGSSGVWYAATFGAVSLFTAARVSPELVLRMYKAQPVGRDRFPAGHAMLDALTERAGLESRPQLYVIPSNLLNAFAVGRRSASAICFTDRLIRSLTTRELAGVMAHEITHVANEDVKVMAIADMVSRFTSVLSTLGMISVFVNLPVILFGGAAQVPWAAIMLLVASPTIGGLLQMALSRTREYDADLGAVMLTGDPDGLASALVKLERAQGAHWEGMMLPGSRMPVPSVLRTHPKTGDRIARLMAFKEMRGGETEVADRETAGARQRRASPVPQVRPKWGRGENAKYSDYASLLNLNPPEPAHPQDDADCIACEDSLAEPRGKPRIRIRSGGVYW